MKLRAEETERGPVSLQEVNSEECLILQKRMKIFPLVQKPL